MEMRCPECGAESGGDYKFCARCGHPFDPYARRSGPAYQHPYQQVPERRSNTGLIVAIVVIVVAVLIIAPAILYIMVLGFGEEGGRQTPTATYSHMRATGGVRITILSITTSVSWDDVRVQVTDGTYWAEWDPRTVDLFGGTTTSAEYAAEAMGSLSLNLTITDVTGNGLMSSGDFFVVEADPGFSSSQSYTVTLIYIPNAETIGIGVVFVG